MYDQEDEIIISLCIIIIASVLQRIQRMSVTHETCYDRKIAGNEIELNECHT
jgi:hypothetical protein